MTMSGPVSRAVAVKLKAERQRMGWKQDDFAVAFAQLMDCDQPSRQSVSAWEKGAKQFDVDDVVAFARIFGSSVAWWMGDVDKRQGAMMH